MHFKSMRSLTVTCRKSISPQPTGAGLWAAKAIICLLLSTASSWLVAGGIYKSIDSAGNIVFTDQPSEDAEAINSVAIKQRAKSLESEESKSSGRDDNDTDNHNNENARPATAVLAAPEPLNPPKPKTTGTDDTARYLPVSRVEILTPEHDTTLLDPLGQIWVEIQSYPTPIDRSGFTAQLWMDDDLVTSDKSTMLRLPPPSRGTHVLRVKLVDNQDRLFYESDAVHIHVKYRFAEQ